MKLLPPSNLFEGWAFIFRIAPGFPRFLSQGRGALSTDYGYSSTTMMIRISEQEYMTVGKSVFRK